jgi:putative ABC transport system permease protein
LYGQALISQSFLYKFYYQYPFDMLKNYLISAFRNISKNKFYSFLNILGLAIGLAAFIFIFLYIQDEISYDKHHEKSSRIYRVESNFNISGKHETFAIVPTPMGPALKLEYPEVEEMCRFMDIGNVLFKYGEKEFYEERFYFTDSTALQIFTHKLLMGNPNTCLVEPNSIVIDQSTALRYFDEANPMGEILESGSGRKYKVTGVMEDLPRSSHLRYQALLSITTLSVLRGEEDFNSMEPGRFWNIGVYTYLLLNENSTMETVHEKFPGFYEKYMKPIGDQISASYELMSTPLAETHFSGNIGADQPKGSMAYIYIFGAIALFILVIASINYMNMATARSVKRAREVGIRKVAGAYRNQLIGQFLTESLLLAVTGLIIALMLVYSLLPDFNTFAEKQISLNLLTQPGLFGIILLVTITIGLASGSYPAFFLSSFKPVSVIKGSSTGKGKSGGTLRRVLVVIQFAIAIAMIIGTVVVSGQLRFLRDKDLGFIKDNIMVLQLQDSAFRSKVEPFKEELLNHSNILAATNSTGIPGDNSWIQVVRIEKDTTMVDDSMILALVDQDFVDTYGIELITGRNFDKEMGTDAEEAVIVNETTVKAYGWEDNPIGKKIHWGFDLDGTGGRMLRVIGVVKDFHFNSLHNKVVPFMMFLSEFDKDYLSLRISPENFGETRQYIEDKWNSFGAGRPFDYKMLTETWDEMYQSEAKIGAIFTIATLLTIFIALLGLMGLSSFVAEQKTKEIGIRKVMGARLYNILGLLYREFVLLITIAFIIAIPVAWWQLDTWLTANFVYHISISIASILLAGLLALAISIITISFHSLKVAMGNPVDAIKYE